MVMVHPRPYYTFCFPLEGRLEGKGHTHLGLGTWNPHQNSQQFATVNEHTIRGWDIRTMEQVWSFENPGESTWENDWLTDFILTIRKFLLDPRKQCRAISWFQSQQTIPLGYGRRRRLSEILGHSLSNQTVDHTCGSFPLDLVCPIQSVPWSAGSYH